MDTIDISRVLSSLGRALPATYLTETGSTNDDLKAAAKDGAPDFTLLFAGRQRGGRGREGRSFHSPQGLYMSILLSAAGAYAAYVTHIAAIAVALAIREVTGEDARVKWVNDVYVRGKKVCGILAENVATSSGRRIVLGIGVNADTPEESIPEELRAVAGTIRADHSDLAAAILRHLLRRIEHFSLEEVRREYRELSFLVGSRVSVVKEEGSRMAAVLGLSDSLGLDVMYDDGSREELIAGEVHLLLNGISR